MKRVFLFLVISLGSWFLTLDFVRADETVTVTATSSDVSENLNLKTVATLFGQSKDLEQFEQLLNDPDSAFSNLDLNGDGEVDYLRVIETADNNRHLVVIQAVLAQDIYQDVASIYVEKDEATDQVTVQVIGDEYIYGTNYIIEPVYIYRPVIYDWFWGPSWVCWHSPYYWGYWPGWWRPYHCIDPFLYWDHCYWHHYHYPICSYRTGHHHHSHYRHMYESVRRNDFAHRHPERSFASRNASRNITNARALESSRRTSVREVNATRGSVTRNNNASSTRISASSVRGEATATRNRTYGSSNVRATVQPSASRTTTSRTASTTATRTQGVSGRNATTTSSSSVSAPTRTSTSRSVGSTVRTSSGTSSRSSSVSAPARTSTSRSSSSTIRSSSSSSMRSSGSAVRSSSSSMRSSSAGASMRTSSSGGSRSGGSRR